MAAKPKKPTVPARKKAPAPAPVKKPTENSARETLILQLEDSVDSLQADYEFFVRTHSGKRHKFLKQLTEAKAKLQAARAE